MGDEARGSKACFMSKATTWNTNSGRPIGSGQEKSPAKVVQTVGAGSCMALAMIRPGVGAAFINSCQLPPSAVYRLVI